MRRRKIISPAVHSLVKDKPVLIHPNEVYSSAAARGALGLGSHALRAEVREGRLRCARRCKRVWFLGRWLLEWLREGELSGPVRPTFENPEAPDDEKAAQTGSGHAAFA